MIRPAVLLSLLAALPLAHAAPDLTTVSERSGFQATGRYDEVVKLCADFQKAYPKAVRCFSFGTTPEGRPMLALAVSRSGALTAKVAKARKLPVLLVQGGIHAGEIDGKDAGLMLLRDIVRGGKAGMLDRANLLFVPIFNVDGHERVSEWNRPNQRGPVHQGWRTTAQNLNLNRDYMKADAPEMQAMLTLINRWSPWLYLDLHVTDGVDYQYDITFGYNGDAGGAAWSPHISAWLNEVYRPAMEAALKRAGHIPGPLVSARDDRDLNKGLGSGTFLPRFSHSYGDLRHLPSVLVENHSLKPYRQRVLGTYVLLESTLGTLGSRATGLQEAIAADRAARPASLPINSSRGGGGQTAMDFLGIGYETYVSPATGGAEVRWLGTPKVYPRLPVFLDQPGTKLVRPTAYWVPVTKPEVIARLKLHGILMEPVSAGRTVRVEMYRLVDPQPQRAEGSLHPYEGRHTLTTRVQGEVRTESFPAGSVRVPTDQPLGELAVALLEPESNDSLLAWGFFLEILQRTEYIEGYALAPMAERMLADDPKLKAEFEARLAKDAKFAANPTARLQWFYERSRFYDDRYLLYPIGVEREGQDSRKR